MMHENETAKPGLAEGGLRFLLAGVLNTGLTFIAYQMFLFAMPHQAAYALAWVGGLAFVLAVYPSKVFGTSKPDASSLIRLAVSYLGVFLLGLLSLEVLTSIGISARIAMVAVIIITTLANFIIGRVLFR